MSDLFVAGLMLFMWVQGLAIGYVIWAPSTPFKRGFVDGLTLKGLLGKKE
jgi:hypothetical protein